MRSTAGVLEGHRFRSVVVGEDLRVEGDRLAVARVGQGGRRVEHPPQMPRHDRSDGVAARVVAELTEDAGEGELQLINDALAQHGPLLLGLLQQRSHRLRDPGQVGALGLIDAQPLRVVAVVELSGQPVHMALGARQLLGEGLHGQDIARDAVVSGQLDSACLYDPLGRPPPHLRSTPAMQPAGRGSPDRRLPTWPAVSPPSAAQPHVVKRGRAVARRLFLYSTVLDADTLPGHLTKPAAPNRAVRNRVCHKYIPRLLLAGAPKPRLFLTIAIAAVGGSTRMRRDCAPIGVCSWEVQNLPMPISTRTAWDLSVAWLVLWCTLSAR